MAAKDKPNTRIDLPGSRPVPPGHRWCDKHKGMAPQAGGCSVGQDRWICNTCWLAHPLLTGGRNPTKPKRQR